MVDLDFQGIFNVGKCCGSLQQLMAPWTPRSPFESEIKTDAVFIWMFLRDTPKWMVYFMENPIKMDDLGGFPIFLETPICLGNL